MHSFAFDIIQKIELKYPVHDRNSNPRRIERRGTRPTPLSDKDIEITK